MKLGKRRHAQLVEYVEALQSVMRLTNWHVYVARRMATVDPDEGVSVEEAAWTTLNPYGADAMLQVSDFLFTLTPSDQRRILVHELCHLVISPLNHAVEDHEPDRRRGERKAFDAAYNRAMEQVVDQFAYMLHEALPLPPKWA